MGYADWRYDDLPGRYSIIRINGRNISLCIDENEYLSDAVVGPFITEVAYNDDYIFVKKVDAPKESRYLDTTNPEYYIVDVASGEVTGPLTHNEYSEEVELFNFQIELEWHKTTNLR